MHLEASKVFGSSLASDVFTRRRAHFSVNSSSKPGHFEALPIHSCWPLRKTNTSHLRNDWSESIALLVLRCSSRALISTQQTKQALVMTEDSSGNLVRASALNWAHLLQHGFAPPPDRAKEEEAASVSGVKTNTTSRASDRREFANFEVRASGCCLLVAT